MKIKCAVYDYYKKSEPISYCFIDLSNPVISYSTYRRLMRLCSVGSNFFIYAPIDVEMHCHISGFDYGLEPIVLIRPYV